MKTGYVNEGQNPFKVPEVVEQSKDARKKLREAERKYYGLGMPKVNHKRCSKCKRPIISGVVHTCGTKASLLTAQIECPNCKALNIIGHDYCYSCKEWLS